MAENICVEYCRDRSFNKRESATEKKQKCPIGMRQEAAIRNINSTKRCKTSFLTFFVLGEATNADTYHAPRIRRCPRTFRTECMSAAAPQDLFVSGARVFPGCSVQYSGARGTYGNSAMT